MQQQSNPVFIIAEIGVNHNGEISIAKKLIDKAKEAGADAVKFQSFSAENLVTKNAEQAQYQTQNIGARDTQYNMLKKLELSNEDHFYLIDYCEKNDISFLSSAFGQQEARFLINDCRLDIIKLGSGELTNAPLLLEISRLGANVIISTGMSNEEEIRNALKVLAFGYFEDKNSTPSQSAFNIAFQKYKDKLKTKVSILQCTTDYPCAAEHVNLNAIHSLQKIFDCPVGFSDHTLGSHIAIAAVAMGAKIIEKHLTLDKNMHGPDHKASLEPNELKTMILSIRDIEKAVGTGELKRFAVEEKIRHNARKSIVAAIPISKGTVITERHITTKRPECGLSPFSYWDILGSKAKKDYHVDEAIL